MATRNLHQVETVFHAALAVSPAERPTYLAQACNGDQSLYEEVSSLISALDSRHDFMEEPALNFGMNVLSRASEDLIGKTIGFYNIMSRLGKGGMGEVYLAEDTRLGRKVALKFLSNEFLEDEWAKRQLMNEARAAAILDHPNICSVYDIEEVEGRSFIVMQYLNGETLAELIRKQSIEPSHVFELARQIAGALAEAHTHGIIHRDMKPGNIMVTAAGQVKVLDFGLAKTVHQNKSRDDNTSQLMQTGVLAGTVAYMSPEQLRGEKLDFSTDIFSLGTVLYELIEGEKPFTRQSQAETISAILTAATPPLTNRRHPHHLDHVIHKCLEKDRDKRYHSANELLSELDRKSPQWSLPLRRLGHAGLVTLTGAVLMLVLVSILFLRPGFQANSANVVSTSPVPTNSQPKPIAPTFSLAVLPISGENLRTNDAYLSDGLTQTFIDRLSSLTQIQVKPYTSVAAYKGIKVDPNTIGLNLEADALLVGQLLRRGNKLLLQTRLILSEGNEIWTDNTELNMRTILTLSDQLTSKVVESLKVHLEGEKNAPAGTGTHSPMAFRQYLLGRYYWRNRNEPNINKAIGHFKAALRHDRLYARAYAGLADSYVLLNTVSFGKMKTEEAMSQAGANARNALEIDPKLPEAHTALGLVNLRYHWKWEEAEASFKNAIAADPNYAPAHYWYSHVLLIFGRSNEAIEESRKAKFLDPSVPSSMNHCRVLFIAGQFETAEKCYADLIAQNPENYHLQYLQALLLQRIGRSEDALRSFERLYAKNRALAGAALGYAYGKANRTADALNVLRQMTELSKDRYVPPQEFAIIYVGLGDNDNAFSWLEKGYDERFAGLIYFGLEPLFSSLRSDPRYDGLIARMNLPTPRN